MSIRKFSAIPKSFTRLDYDIPERYRNAFYLANAAFFDSTNWFLHRAYEVAFPGLKKIYRQQFKKESVGDVKVYEKLENIVQSLDQCNSIIDVRFPVKRQDGKLEIIRGFKAHYGETVGNTPCLGGLLVHQDLTRDQMKALSLISFAKNACLGTGLSGAITGLKINPNQYSLSELKGIVNSFISELYHKGYCNHRDVVHPDINTSEREMMWVSEAFANSSGQSLNAAATGKPLEYGGVEGYGVSGALGALKALEVFTNNREVMLKTGCIETGLRNKRFIIQGLGKLGKPLSLLLVKKGAVCLGVKEKDAYIYNAKGIDLKDLFNYIDTHGTIENFGLSKTEYPDSIFTEECDILVLAACHKSLICHIAKDVKARIILEAADGPITPSAHKILSTKSKVVIPDIYACAGATVASYFEYLRNLQQIGLATETILRFSSEMYSKIVKTMFEDQQKVVGSSRSQTQYNDVFTPLDGEFLKNSIDCVYTEVGQEILKNMEILKLGVDVRSAAYAVAIGNIFKTIFDQKLLL